MIQKLTPHQFAATSRRRVDVREYPEFAAASIFRSHLVPLSAVGHVATVWNPTEPIALICRSGKRAMQAAEKLAAMGFSDLAVLDGGIEAWRAAGLPLESQAHKPWSLERQVRAIAGAIILLSMALGLAVSPWFFAWTAFVGAGLFVSGVTDVCLMATLLGKLPWNRPPDGCPMPPTK